MKLLLYTLLIILTACLFWLWSTASAAPNPTYIPLIHACSNYQSHCGNAFKRALALTEYRVCRVVENETCQEWYHPSELHYIFNALPGWVD